MSISYQSVLRAGLALLLGLVMACQRGSLRGISFSEPVNTSTRPTTLMQGRAYDVSGIRLDSYFPGARMGDLKIVDTVIHINIAPENTPINPSPWYAFRITGQADTVLTLQLNFEGACHRYPPRVSEQGRNWSRLDSSQFLSSPTEESFRFQLSKHSDTLYVAAQELLDSDEILRWMDSLQYLAPSVLRQEIGRSVRGRPLWRMHLGNPEAEQCIVLLSRQHPPEVSGYLAMRSFVRRLLSQDTLSKAFRQRYQILLYPMLNPDGVDLGHWRHSSAGIDLNRDWAYFRQPETRQVALDILEQTEQRGVSVLLGIDFHSTWNDRYYVPTEHSQIPGFSRYWIQSIDEAFPDYRPDIRPGAAEQPTSKSWFTVRLRAEGITYEVGDLTDRDFVREKAAVAARELMKLLILR